MIALSCGFPPSRDLPTYAQRAESLGYSRVWVFDSPALYGDVWVALARIVESTERIGVSTGVAVPTLRHPVVTASAIATVEELAPGRLAVAFGTGFTARLAMGKRAMRWADLARYVETVRALLRGDVVDVEGANAQLIYSPAFGPARPIDLPLYVAVAGPKGFGVAHDIADGVVLGGIPPDEERDARWSTVAMLVNGTVLDDGEDETSERVRAAVGPWLLPPPPVPGAGGSVTAIFAHIASRSSGVGPALERSFRIILTSSFSVSLQRLGSFTARSPGSAPIAA